MKKSFLKSMAVLEDTKEDKNYESPVEVFSLFSKESHYHTTSSAWMNISGCRKEVVVGSTPIFCEIIGHGPGHNGKSNRGGASAFDFGISVNDSIHQNTLGKGIAATHLDIWTPLTCYWVQQLKPNTSYTIQLKIRSRDNASECGISSPYLIIKLYKQIEINNLKNNNVPLWINIDKANKQHFNINYEYRLSTGTGDSTIIPFKISKQYLYYYDIIADSDDEGEDEELIIAKIKYDNKSKILSKNKNYQRFVRVNRIQYKFVSES